MISERTRDKIAATRRKGKWTGGMPLLGYDVDTRGGRLLVNEEEAARVREIFELYLDRQSLITTAAELERRGWTTKRWVTKKGREMGGKPFGKNNLFKLLTNRIYLGKITYKDEFTRASTRPSSMRKSSSVCNACSNATAARAERT
jgi:site-specific DNA recombinase